MSSTENLLQDSGDKSTNTLESGYHSDKADYDFPSPKHKEKASKKKKHQKDVGLENRGFESDSEQANRSVKHYTKVHRTSSESVALQLTTKPGQTDEKRRHSFSGQPSIDAAQTADVVAQKGSRRRRRSSSADEDLRRRACFNSMRLRRVSSPESSQLPPSEVDVSVDDEVFYEDFAATDAREKHETFGDGDRRNNLKENKGTYSMGSLCDVVEMENRKLDEYSRRLSCALEERAKLEQELSLLRKTASASSRPAEEKWKISPQIHFRNEKYNSERRISTRGNGGIQFSLEQLKRIQYGQSPRKLPDVPRAVSSKGDEFGEEIRPVIDKKDERLPQRKITEESPPQLEQRGKRNSYSFPLSDTEKERRERKTADLAADLWQKLLKGEKFHVEGENIIDKTRDGTKTGSPREVTKSANSSYAKPEMIQRDSGRDSIGRLAEVPIPTTSGVEKREKQLVRSESESNLARTDAFRRNQRRPLRYKRRSTSTEALPGATQPSTETANGRELDKPEKLEGIRGTEVVSQNHSKWFDYMLPPGKRGNRKDTALQNSPQAPRTSQQGTPDAEQSLSEKLRYYQGLQEQRSREENSFDLVDAFMAAEDAEAEREYQRKAAGEAAILRREASRLLYQAMNLERICDPNARVRHIFTPY